MQASKFKLKANSQQSALLRTSVLALASLYAGYASDGMVARAYEVGYPTCCIYNGGYFGCEIYGKCTYCFGCSGSACCYSEPAWCSCS